MSKVIFKIDQQKEYEYHQLFLHVPGLAVMSPLTAATMEDKQKIIQDIETFWSAENKLTVGLIEKKWREVESDYFPLIREITRVDWLYENYFAYFLAFSKIMGFSNPFNMKSQEIVLTTEAIINPRFLVGHELFHSHYFYIVDKLGMTPRLNKTLFTEGVAA